MRKFKLLIAPLLLLPVIVSCGGGNKSDQVVFSLSSDQPTIVTDKTTTVYIDWTPTNTIKFESFTFECKPNQVENITFDQAEDPRPMPVKIAFVQDITEDIAGTLSFTYEDVTAKTKGESKVNVIIAKPEDSSTVTEEEFDNAIKMEEIQFLQQTIVIVDEGETGTVNLQMSPTAVYNISNSGQEYEEIYSYGNDEKCTYISRTSQTGQWSDPVTIKKTDLGEDYEAYFPTPKSIGSRFVEMFKSQSLKYDDFKYQNDVYVASVTDKGGHIEIVSISFKNKKLDKVVITEEGSESSESSSFTYNEETPKDPSK